ALEHVLDPFEHGRLEVRPGRHEALRRRCEEVVRRLAAREAGEDGDVARQRAESRPPQQVARGHRAEHRVFVPHCGEIYRVPVRLSADPRRLFSPSPDTNGSGFDVVLTRTWALSKPFRDLWATTGRRLETTRRP